MTTLCLLCFQYGIMTSLFSWLLVFENPRRSSSFVYCFFFISLLICWLGIISLFNIFNMKSSWKKMIVFKCTLTVKFNIFKRNNFIQSYNLKRELYVWLFVKLCLSKFVLEYECEIKIRESQKRIIFFKILYKCTLYKEVICFQLKKRKHVF